jgi:hypothetical protein
MNSRDSLDLSIEPAAIHQLTAEQKDRLTDLLDGYLRQLEKGLPPPREDLLAANPDLVEPLQLYFSSLDELHDMAAGFPGTPNETCHESPTLPGDERRLGDFRLLREIGRGGMGVVYEAQQISLGRRVALKVLPFAAVLDSRQIARFKHEAQAAAQLNHPNIVSVFAVGVERGVHYYAMQFIDGQPLDRALIELRQKYLPKTRAAKSAALASTWSVSHNLRLPDSLDTAKSDHASTQQPFLSSRAAGNSEYFRAVVRLGIQAASALHAAHENGIVHRDIKPSNLLLDGNGKLWVTDFGLARRQTDAPLTRTGDLVGTLRYMSPEQALGQVALIDHRTDIYSLGATLYELLTLEPAFPGDEGAALIRQIERNEPRPPRQLQPKIPVDLQTVILKGMAKRREDRYATAQEFADDLQRVLEGKPTVARPPSLLDRTARWAQRHREIVAVGSLVGLLALLGLTVGTFMLVREQKRTDDNFKLAEQRFHDAQAAVEGIGMRFSDKLGKIPGAARIRQDLLNQTLKYFRESVEKAKDNPVLREDLASTYGRIGKLSAEIGSNADAIEADRMSIKIFDELVAANPQKADYRRQLGVSQNYLALALERAGKSDEARSAYAKAIRLQEEILTAGEDRGKSLEDLANDCSNLGHLQNEMGDVDGAAASIGRAVDLQRQLRRDEPDDPERMRNLAVTLNKLGGLYAEHQPERSIKYYEEAAALQKKAADLRPDESVYRGELALTYNNLGVAQSRSGAVADATESYKKVVDLMGELVQQSPAEKSYRRTLALGFNNLGEAQRKLGYNKLGEAQRKLFSAAESSFHRAVALQEILVEQDRQNVDLQSELGVMYNDLGVVLEELKRAPEAVTAYEKAVDHQRHAVASAAGIARYRQYLSKHYFNYGQALRRTGHPADAARIALARRELWPKDPQHLFSVAEELAVSAREISAGKADPAGEITADKCAAYALETLKQATAAGWRPPPSGNWMKSFSTLKNRDDFLALTRS